MSVMSSRALVVAELAGIGSHKRAQLAAEALKEFNEAIKLGDVRGGAYKEALEGKKKLNQP